MCFRATGDERIDFRSWNLQVMTGYIDSQTGRSLVLLSLAKSREARVAAALAAAGLALTPAFATE